MHSAADYGSWFSPKNAQFFLQLGLFVVWLRSHHKLQGSFESVPKTASSRRSWYACFGAHPSAIAAFAPAQTDRTKRENQL